ncbi:hypothetical protein [Arthrobacter sp. TMS1-12-1]
MTSAPPGGQQKDGSRRRRAAAAAALVAALGLTGWAVAAGPLAPAAEPRPAQAGSSPSASPDAVDSTPQESTPAPSAQASSAPTSSAPTSSAPTSSAPTSSATAPSAPRSAAAPSAPVSSDPAPSAAAPGSAPEGPAAIGRGTKAIAPAPAGRIIDQPPPVAPAKSLKERAPVAEGVAARVASMKAVDGEARGLGEVGGPAVQFTLEVTNSTKAPISLAEAVVNVEAGEDRSPAELLSGPGAVPFPAEVGPGQSVSGVFVFQIPPERRKSVRVLFHYQAVLPVAAFQGAAPLQGEAP